MNSERAAEDSLANSSPRTHVKRRGDPRAGYESVETCTHTNRSRVHHAPQAPADRWRNRKYVRPQVSPFQRPFVELLDKYSSTSSWCSFDREIRTRSCCRDSRTT